MADGTVGVIEPQAATTASPPPVPQALPAPPSSAAGETAAGEKGMPKGKDKDAEKDKDQAAARDPIHDLVDRLERVRPQVEMADAPLAARIKRLVDQAETPGKAESAPFRTGLAYAVQDFEKLVGKAVAMPQDLREEMGRLAATAPGLTNNRMQDLVRATPTIADRGLVRDIRATATSVAGERDQDSPDVRDRIDVLQNRVRLAAHPADVQGPKGAAGAQARPPEPEPGDPGPSAPPGADTGSGRATDSQRAAKAVGTGEATVPVEVHPPAPTPLQPAAYQVQQPGGPGATVAIMSALRRPEAPSPAPWDRQLTPLGDRLAAFMERGQANRDEAVVTAAERSGQEAARALQAFANGPGAAVMGKIRAAARTDPDGMQGVVAGMREGGRYEDLRHGFDAGLQQEKGLAAALDRVSVAVGQYGAHRAAVDAVAATRASAASVAARFDKLDAEVGAAAASTPSRQEGKSQLGELAEKMGDKAAEIAKKAADALRAVFQRSPGAEHGPSGPSP